MSKNINPFELNDAEHRAVRDIYTDLIHTMNEAFKTHGVSNATEAMIRFTADVLIGTAKQYDHGNPVQLATNFGKVIIKIVIDTLEDQHQHE